MRFTTVGPTNITTNITTCAPRGGDRLAQWTDSSSGTTSSTTTNYTVNHRQREATCLDRGDGLPDAQTLEPHQDYLLGREPTETFGNTGSSGDPCFGYTNGSTDSTTVNQGQTDHFSGDLQTRAPLHFRFREELARAAGLKDPGDVIDDQFGTHIVGDVDCQGGATQAQRCVSSSNQEGPERHPTVSPDHQFLEAAWHEATRCPEPQLPPGITRVGSGAELGLSA